MNQGMVASMLLESMRYVWCERNDTDILEFNCSRCEFEQDGNCLAKRFIKNHHEEWVDFPKRMIKESED